MRYGDKGVRGWVGIIGDEDNRRRDDERIIPRI